MRLSEPRIPPLPEQDWDDEARQLLSRFGEGSQVKNIFRTLVRHPGLMKRWLVFGNHILGKSSLPARQRELVILRTGWRCRSGYEWGQHAVIGRDCGLSEAEIERITQGPDAPGWDPFDAVLLRAADELHDDSFIGEETWRALAQRFDEAQLMDLVFTVGQYHLVSMALNTLGVQLEDGVAGLPRSAPGSQGEN